MAPPRKRHTGRNWRERKRDEQRARRAAVVSSLPAGRQDQFKIALEEIVVVEEHYLGRMRIVCRNCGAKHFSCEMTDGATNLFSLYCERGKFTLPAYKVWFTNGIA